MSYIQKTYNRFVRPRLPEKLGQFNDVTVRQPKLLLVAEPNPPEVSK